MHERAQLDEHDDDEHGDGVHDDDEHNDFGDDDDEETAVMIPFVW